MSGGKNKKPVIGYHHHYLFQFVVGCDGFDAFLEMRGGEKTAWQGELTSSGTVEIDAPDLWGGEKKEGGIVGSLTVLDGSPTQQPDAYLTEKQGAKQSGMRGKTVVIFKGGQWGAFHDYAKPPQFKFRYIKGHWEGGCWYPEKAEVDISTSQPGRFQAGEWPLADSESSYEYSPEPLAPGATAIYPSISSALANSVGHTIGGGNVKDSIHIGSVISGASSSGLQPHPWVSYSSDVSQANELRLIYAQHAVVGFFPGEAMHAGHSSWPGKPAPAPGASSGWYLSGNQLIFSAAPPDRANQLQSQGYAIPNPYGQNHYVVTLATTTIVVRPIARKIKAMNPAHIIYFAATQRRMGAKPTPVLDDASFRAAADILHAEGFGLHTSYDHQEEDVQQFIDRILKIINGSMSANPSTGKWHLDLIRPPTDTSSLPVLIGDDIAHFEEQPTTLDQAVNSISVEWFDSDAKELRTTSPVQSMAAINGLGVSHQILRHPEIPSEELALRVAAREVNAKTGGRRFELKTNRVPWNWRRGTYFIYNDPKRGINNMVCLLLENLDGQTNSNALVIKAVEAIYSQPETTYIAPQPPADDNTGRAEPVTDIVAFEAPYAMLAEQMPSVALKDLDDESGFVAIAAAEPAGSPINYDLHTGADGNSLQDKGTGNWCPTANVVEASARLDTAFTLANGSNLDRVSVGSWALWGSEIVRIDAITPSTGAVTFARGCIDTVPVDHAAGQRIWFVSEWAGTDQVEYADGQSVTAKAIARGLSGQLAQTGATASVGMNERQIRPYPVGDLQVGGQSYPNTSESSEITWVGRNRITQADKVVAHRAAAVAVEAGTTYSIEFQQPPGTVVHSAAALTGESYNAFVPNAGEVKVTVTTHRAGHSSYQSASHAYTKTLPAQPILDELGAALLDESSQPLIEE